MTMGKQVLQVIFPGLGHGDWRQSEDPMEVLQETSINYSINLRDHLPSRLYSWPVRMPHSIC